MLNMRGQKVRNLYKNLDNWLSNQNINALMSQSIKAEELFRKVGITFNVYGEDEAEERLIPFDLMPRIIDSKDCLLYTSPSPRDRTRSRMPSSA